MATPNVTLDRALVEEVRGLLRRIATGRVTSTTPTEAREVALRLASGIARSDEAAALDPSDTASESPVRPVVSIHQAVVAGGRNGGTE